MASVYEQVYRHSRDDPEGFWAQAAEPLYWHRRWDTVRDDRRPPFHRWFAAAS